MHVKDIAVTFILVGETKDAILDALMPENKVDITLEAQEVCGIIVDTLRHRAFLDGMEIELTAVEFDLLALLAADNGSAVSYEEALEKVWGDFAHTSRKMVSNCVSRLRKKIGSRRIEAVKGFGYRLR